MTIVKRKLSKNHHKIFKTYKKFFTESIMKELREQITGIGHSDIRGFGLLLTNRLMVRRELYYLSAWITA